MAILAGESGMVDSSSVPKAPRARRSSFQLALALVMTAAVLVGFGYEVPTYIVHPKAQRPAIMWVHGVAMLAWIVLYVTQTALVRTSNLRLHRRLGQFGMVLALVMVPLMLSASWIMDRFNRVHFPGPSLAADVSFVAVELWDAVGFAVLIGLGAAMRTEPEFHRRLMFLGTCILVDAGFSRFPVPWGPAGTELPEWAAYIALDALIVITMVRDWRLIGRPHLVFAITLPVMLAGQLLVIYLTQVHPHWWVALTSALLGLA